MPVLNAMWLVCGSAKPGLSVSLIFGVVAFEPDHFAVTLKGKHMCGDTIEEPPVVANDHGTAGEILQSLFQGTHGIYIKIIGRFVKQKDVGLFLEHAGKMYAISFAS